MAFKKGQSGNPNGRPKGTGHRFVSIYDHWSEEAIKEYFEFLQDNYKESDRLGVFVGEQLMGKATQRTELTGEDGGPVQIANVEITFRKAGA